MAINDSVIRAGAAQFGFDLAGLKYLGSDDGSTPHGVLFTNEQGAFVIKIIPLSAEQLPVLRAKMAFVDYLHTNGVPTPRCVPSTDGHLVELIAEAGRSYAVSKLERVAGHLVNFDDPAEWNASFFQRWGRIIGRIHALSQRYHDDFRAAIPSWEREHAFFCRMSQDDPAILARWQAIGEAMRALPQTDDTFGLIHNDPHSWNFLVAGDTLTILDFDTCTRHWFAYDLGVALFHPIFASRRRPADEAAAFISDLTKNLLDGYRQECALERFWLAQIPLFMKYRRAVYYFTLPKAAKEAPSEALGENDDTWTGRTVRDLRKAIVNDDAPVTNLVLWGEQP
jgi:Ser/Thr protein kinase RdoA (MazF antagonist)